MTCLLGYSSMISRKGVADDCLLGASLSGCGLFDGEPLNDNLHTTFAVNSTIVVGRTMRCF